LAPVFPSIYVVPTITLLILTAVWFQVATVLNHLRNQDEALNDLSVGAERIVTVTSGGE